jgi:importin-8
MQKYGNPRYAAKEYNDFAHKFRSTTSLELLSPVMTTIGYKIAGSFLTDDVFRMCLTYISNSIEMSPTYKAIKPHLNVLICQVLFPTFSLTESEIELFECDPAEFIRKVHDVTEDWLDPRLAAVTVLQFLTRYRQKDVVPMLLPYIQNMLGNITMTKSLGNECI